MGEKAAISIINDMMKVKIIFFAYFKDKAGTKNMELNLASEMNVGDLKNRLAEEIPALKDVISRAIVSVNQEYAADEHPLSDGSEVAFFPPVSGGDNFTTIVSISEQPIDVVAAAEKITNYQVGAVCTFTGIVRGKTERDNPHNTFAIEYEAYRPMAEKKLAEVAEEIRSRWNDVYGIVLIQRVGRLDVGEVAVIVACSASHRDSGIFDAARYGIDRLKEIVPVWKKEYGPDGEMWVEGDYYPEAP
jgi:molybdopterin converting factor subunit 1